MAINRSLFQKMFNDCEHSKLVLVYTEGRKKNTKDFVLRCDDCDTELFRTNMKGKEIFNLLP